jgi:DNA-binding CsgD family transcriptional regulator
VVLEERMRDALESLSTRERQVLALVATGLANWEVARSLKPEIGEETVKTHLGSIYRKLGVHRRVEAVAIWFGGGQP